MTRVIFVDQGRILFEWDMPQGQALPRQGEWVGFWQPPKDQPDTYEVERVTHMLDGPKEHVGIVVACKLAAVNIGPITTYFP